MQIPLVSRTTLKIVRRTIRAAFAKKKNRFSNSRQVDQIWLFVCYYGGDSANCFCLNMCSGVEKVRCVTTGDFRFDNCVVSCFLSHAIMTSHLYKSFSELPDDDSIRGWRVVVVYLNSVVNMWLYSTPTLVRNQPATKSLDN